MKAEEVLEAWSDGVEHPMFAPAEEALSFTAEDHHMHVVVEASAKHRIVQLPHHCVGVGIRGRSSISMTAIPLSARYWMTGWSSPRSSNRG